jgi:hypothetical protein
MWVQEGLRFDKDDLIAAADLFEEHTYPTDRAFFGSEWSPGVDNDPHLSILHAKGLGSTVAGYYSSADEFVSAVREDSNEMEMFYINVGGGTRINDDFYNGVLAHEFQHLIHYRYDPNEASWINEAMSELAMTINGYEDRANLDGFTRQHDVTLIPAGQQVISYGAVMLFGVYLYENTTEGTIKKLIADKKYGISSVESRLMENRMGDFTDLLSYMATATLLDSPPSQALDLPYKTGFTGLDFVKPEIVTVNNPLNITSGIKVLINVYFGKKNRRKV